MQGDVLGSATLTPEKTTELEIGADLRFFNNLFGIDVTYYDKSSVDQIFQVPVPSSTGYLAMVSNNGEMTNSGIEITLTATPVNSDGFRWDAMLNWSKNTNKVVALADGVESITIGGFEGSSIRAVAGQPYGTIFGFGWLRDKNGNVVIETDSNSATGTPVGFPILDPLEKAFGSSNPDWLMGFRNTFSYEGFTLSALIDIRKGGSIWNGTRGALYYFGTHKDTEVRGSTKVFTGVKGTMNDKNEIVSNGEANNISVTLDQNWLAFNNGNGFFGSNTEDFIEDGGWVRLRELSLSYQLPKSLTEDTPISGVRVTYTGRNLWLSTDYKGVDPETNLMGAANAQGLDYFNMPGTRSHTFTLNVDF